MSGRVCPWSSWDEWSSVRIGLLGQDAQAAAAAVERVVAWRRRGRLPLGVDVTSSLVYTFLRDPLAPRQHLRSQLSCASSESSLQNEYSLTLIRFVNGVSDSVQKGKVASSVSKHAEFAGLHPMLVDVRHEATHNNLPSLHTLRLAAAHALAWLQQNYWEAQSDRVCEHSTDAARLVLKLVENQVARLRCSARQGNDLSSDSESENVEDLHVGATECTDSLSPATLKKQQRSLLNDLKQVVPASQPTALAAAVLHCNIIELQEGSSSLHLSASPHKKQKSFAKKRKKGNSPAGAIDKLHPAMVSTLVALELGWCYIIPHLVAECVAGLSDVKQFLVNGSSHPQQLRPPCSGPAPTHGAIAWCSAVIEACMESRGPESTQQVVQYALQRLFQESLLFSCPLHTMTVQEQQHPSSDERDFTALANFYRNSSANSCEDEFGSSQQRGTGSIQSGSGQDLDASGRSESSRPQHVPESFSPWADVASAFPALEQELSNAALKAPQNSMCYQLGQLASLVMSHCSGSQKRPEGSAASGSSSYEGKDFMPHLQALLAHCKTSDQHCSDPQSRPAVVSPKLMQPDHQDAPAATTAAHLLNIAHHSSKRKRVYVAEGWLGCPIGTLPTCIAGVGELPDLRIRTVSSAPGPVSGPVPPHLVRSNDNDVQLQGAALSLHTQPQAATNLLHQRHQLSPDSQLVQHGAQHCAFPQKNGVSGAPLTSIGPSDRSARVRSADNSQSPAQRDVLEAWDNMMTQRSVQLAGYVSGVVQQFAALDKCVDLLGEERNVMAFDPERTIRGMLQELNVTFEGMQSPFSRDVAAYAIPRENLNVQGAAAGSSMTKGRRVDAGDARCIDTQRPTLWNADVERKLQGIGLLQLLKRCAAEML